MKKLTSWVCGTNPSTLDGLGLHLTECIDQLVLASQLSLKFVIFLKIINKYILSDKVIAQLESGSGDRGLKMRLVSRPSQVLFFSRNWFEDKIALPSRDLSNPFRFRRG